MGIDRIAPFFRRMLAPLSQEKQETTIDPLNLLLVRPFYTPVRFVSFFSFSLLFFAPTSIEENDPQVQRSIRKYSFHGRIHV